MTTEKTRTPINAEMIQPEARFRFQDGTVFVCVDVAPYSDGTPGARMRLSTDKFPNYRDSIEEIVAFFNEENAEMVKGAE